MTDLHRSSQRIETGRILLNPTETDPTNGSGRRREFDCIFMKPGRVKTVTQQESRWLISAEVIKTDADKFDSVASYIDHVEWLEDAPHVRRLVGVTFDTRWSDEDNALVGKIRLYDKEPGSPGAFIGALMDQILADKTQGKEVPSIGLSATFYHTSTFDSEAGLLITTGFKHVESIDFVYSAGAGGYVRAALSAIGRTEGTDLWLADSPDSQGNQGAQPPPTRSNTMPDEVLTDTDLGGNGSTPPPEPPLESPPDPNAQSSLDLAAALDTVNRVAARIASLGDQVDSLTGIVAQQQATQTVQGMGQAPRDHAISMGHDSLDQIDEAFGALMEGRRPADGVRPLSGIREFYMLMSGDYNLTQKFYPDRVKLANVNSSTRAGLVANRLNKLVVNEFKAFPRWWEPIFI
ncbi:MAG: hypothetical protein KAJ19_14625, partial [Gammaproteobacteria bacterium]|nr:hypothetical protein [Gammaproteobacteria bacterium]